jgi:adenylosuccinate synthase
VKTIVVGGQYGDEGKGKILSYLACKDDPDVVVRGGVGPNAGHTIYHNGKKYGLRLIPCGFPNERSRLLIGAGVLVNPAVFLKEVEEVGAQKRAGIDFRATAITQEHLERDKDANSKKIGTTGTGCGPAMMDRVARVAKLVSEVPELKPYLCDVEQEVNSAKDVLVEGTQGSMLSNFFGTYPFVTSKDINASSIAADVGLGPKSIDEVIMVIKAYTTRVGNGPFPGEITTEEAVSLGYQEYGTVTGRPRRTSKELHFEDLRKAARINSATQIAITKIDVVFPSAAGATKFDSLPQEAQKFVLNVEKELGVPVTLIGTGSGTNDIIDRRKNGKSAAR